MLPLCYQIITILKEFYFFKLKANLCRKLYNYGRAKLNIKNLFT